MYVVGQTWALVPTWRYIFYENVKAEIDLEHTQAETERKAFSFSSAR